MRKLILITILFWITTVLFGQISWIRTFGDTGIDEGREVQLTVDNGYVLIGTIRIPDTQNTAALLVKTDSAGDSIWTQTYGNSLRLSGTSVKQTADSGFVITGFHQEDNTDTGDVILFKVDYYGNLEWEKIYANPFFSSGLRVIITSDGGYLMLGFCILNSYDSYLIKTASNGDTTWTKIIEDFLGHDVVETTDGGYLIAGYQSYNTTICKTDSAGNVLWSRHYQQSPIECSTAHSIASTHNGNYIVTGETNYPEGLEDDSHIFLLKINAQGDSLGFQLLGLTDYCAGNSVCETSDRGFIVTGSQNYSFGLMKTDSLGNPSWTRTYGEYYNDVGNYVLTTQDNGFIIAGTLNNDLCLIKTDSLGQVNYTGLFDSEKSQGAAEYCLFTNYPNPFNPSTTFSYQLPRESTVSLSVYDVSGRLVETIVNTTQSAGAYSLQWNAGHYSSGIYFYQLQAGEFQQVKKCLLIK